MRATTHVHHAATRFKKEMEAIGEKLWLGWRVSCRRHHTINFIKQFSIIFLYFVKIRTPCDLNILLALMCGWNWCGDFSTMRVSALRKMLHDKGMWMALGRPWLPSTKKTLENVVACRQSLLCYVPFGDISFCLRVGRYGISASTKRNNLEMYSTYFSASITLLKQTRFPPS